MGFALYASWRHLSISLHIWLDCVKATVDKIILATMKKKKIDNLPARCNPAVAEESGLLHFLWVLFLGFKKLAHDRRGNPHRLE